ncbi:hypothetical protein SEA_BEEGEE_77 [Gordonia phage BeeGee]|nr:hypothetical protein SEA_BEEGEE_77 [Gordonia phage BeeGee]
MTQQKPVARLHTSLAHAISRWMRTRGWTMSALDDTVRSRLARAVGDWNRWHDWGRPVMWLVGRYDCGNAGPPRGRDLWWIPTQYVEGIATSLVADFDQRFGCYITTRYTDVSATIGDIPWRIYDLQDDGLTTKVGLYPNHPDHGGHMQPLPWQDINAGLFVWWFLWQHKAKSQWFGLRRWIYYKALHAAVHGKVPFTCQQAPPPRSGGYSHWHCELPRKHVGAHRFRNYSWASTNVKYDPVS